MNTLTLKYPKRGIEPEDKNTLLHHSCPLSPISIVFPSTSLQLALFLPLLTCWAHLKMRDTNLSEGREASAAVTYGVCPSKIWEKKKKK